MHVKKTMKAMRAKGTYKKGDGLTKVIPIARKTYHKVKKGGAEDEDEDSKEDEEDLDKKASKLFDGGRRRRTRRRSRKSMY